MVAHQAPPSLGFSRQEHWSGLPFPSPMHESKNWKWSHWVVSNSQRPHGLQPTRLLHPWDFPGKSTGVGCHWELGGLLSMGSHRIGHGWSDLAAAAAGIWGKVPKWTGKEDLAMNSREENKIPCSLISPNWYEIALQSCKSAVFRIKQKSGHVKGLLEIKSFGAKQMEQEVWGI